MKTKFNWLLLLFTFFDITVKSVFPSLNDTQDTFACHKSSKCVPLTQCRPKSSGIILYPCHFGLNLICCPIDAIPLTTSAVDTRKAALFPVNCGEVFVENKIVNGEEAEFGQFPWMALLGYQQKGLDILEFLCGGTIITTKFVMTAAHCITVDVKRELMIVRLGENDLKTSRDCYMLQGQKVCVDPHVDMKVEKFFQHPKYNKKTLKNDIGLVKVKGTIKFTDYIQPICLPFERKLETSDLVGQKFLISGWGKTNPRNIGGSSTLQYANVFVWDLEKCNRVLPLEVRNLTDSQLCANGRKEDACKGDSGGPLFGSTTSMDGKFRSFQVGIVSFAPTMTCGIEELPPIYTRVDKYLSWIMDSVE